MLCTQLSCLVCGEGVERGEGRGWQSRKAFEPCSFIFVGEGGGEGFVMSLNVDGRTLFRGVGRGYSPKCTYLAGRKSNWLKWEGSGLSFKVGPGMGRRLWRHFRLFLSFHGGKEKRACRLLSQRQRKIPNGRNSQRWRHRRLPILGPTLNDKPLPSDLSQLDLRPAR